VLSTLVLFLAILIYQNKIHIKISGRSNLWKIVMVVLGFVVLRRVTAFLIETGALQNLLVVLGYGASALQTVRPLQVIDRIIDPILVDSMLIVIFYSMYMLGQRGKGK
jgi:hypothetical protein